MKEIPGDTLTLNIPCNPDSLELIGGDHTTPVLQYRDPKSGKICTVPNTYLNQTSEIRLMANEFYLALAERRLAELRDSSHGASGGLIVGGCQERIERLLAEQRELYANVEARQFPSSQRSLERCENGSLRVITPGR